MLLFVNETRKGHYTPRAKPVKAGLCYVNTPPVRTLCTKPGDGDYNRLEYRSRGKVSFIVDDLRLSFPLRGGQR